MRTLRWASENTVRALAAALAGYAVLALAGAAGAERIDAGEYLFTLFSSAVFMWPLYLKPKLTRGQQVRDRVAGTFPPRPQVLMRGSLAVRGVLLAPEAGVPGGRGALVEAAVHPPRRGYAGVFCRGSRDAATGYALLVDRAGRVRVERREAGAVTVLRRVNLARNERSDPGEPTLLRIACGAGRPGTPATIAFTVNASPYAYVADARSLPAEDATSAGLLSTGRATRAEHAAVWLAE